MNPNQPNQPGSQNPQHNQPQQGSGAQIFERNGKWGIGTNAQSAQYNFNSKQEAEIALSQQHQSA
jgi:hypothetical protein